MSEEHPNLEAVHHVQFEATTGNVHIDEAIKLAAQIAMNKVRNVLVSEMTTAMKQSLEALDRFPPPPPGSILRRKNNVDVICRCGRCVSFPIHPEPTPPAP